MKIHFLIPNNLNALSEIFIYENNIIQGLKMLGHQVRVHRFEGNFPFVPEEQKQICLKVLSGLPEGEPVVVDGRILPVVEESIPEHSMRSWIGLIHIPMSLNPRLTAYQRALVHASEQEAFQKLGKVIVTNRYAEELLMGMVSDVVDMHRVIPGVGTYPRKPVYESHPVRLLCIANYTRNKDHTILIRALSALKDKQWILDCFGDMDMDRDYLGDLQALIRRFGLQEKVFIHAPLAHNEFSEAYLKSDLFVYPSGFELYGTSLAEALAHGLPVIASNGGGIAKSIPATTGKFFKPGDVYGLLTILELLLENSELYKILCGASSQYYRQAQSWEESVLQFEKVLTSM